MRSRNSWLRILGGGCFLNIALTGLLVAVFSALAQFSINSIVFPFLMGASASFGLTLYLLRQSNDGFSSTRRVFLALAGVLLGSVMAVFGIAGYLMAAGS